MKLSATEREQLVEGFQKELAGLQAQIDERTAGIAELQKLAGVVPLKALEALLEHWEAQQQADFLGKERREALMICAGELAQVLEQHGWRRSELALGVELVAAETEGPLGPGEVRECGAVYELRYGPRGVPAFVCTRPAGHGGKHESHSNLLHTWEG